ncbi:hypothetical protein GCM10010381_07210 [Streptomyces xantholiticus]|nr:hypothetical protein GCM10010381_07210 [Streptomyces xantholiticus]
MTSGSATERFRAGRTSCSSTREWQVTSWGSGRTETVVQVSNRPGRLLKAHSMGRPSPGYQVELLDPATGEAGAAEGEIAVDLSARPVGLMTGYHGHEERTAEAMAGGFHRTGDIGSRDDDGYITYVGRSDDVLKASRSGGTAFRSRIAA